jgi:hypothetical protein
MDERCPSRVEETLHWYSRIYLGGIPATINDDSAFLSFVCTLAATEALAGYRYGSGMPNGERFTSLVSAYFPEEYTPLADQLWAFRNSMVHAFTTGPFALTHHHSEAHFRTVNSLIILNAEDFYAALLSAAQRYFREVRSTPELQRILVQRLQDPKGGGIGVGPVEFPQPESEIESAGKISFERNENPTNLVGDATTGQSSCGSEQPPRAKEGRE